MESAQYLINAGARVNSPSQNGMKVTPLHSAAAGRHTVIVKLLLEHDADPNALQEGGFTPLHAAAQNGNVQTTHILLFHAPIRIFSLPTANPRWSMREKAVNQKPLNC